MKKKALAILLCIVSVSLLSVGIYTQLIRPLSISDTLLLIEPFSEDELLAKIRTLAFRSDFETKILNSQHMKITLSDAEQISFEELEAVRDKYQ